MAGGIATACSAVAPRLGSELGALGGAGVLLLAVGLGLRRSVTVPGALVLLGGQYAALLELGGVSLLFGSLVSAGFVLVAELSFFSLEHRRARALLRAVGLAVGAALLGAGLLAVSRVAVTRGVAIEGLGVVAAVLAVGVLARLAWRDS